MVRGVRRVALVAGAVLSLLLLGPGQAMGSGSFSWSQPSFIDQQQPFSSGAFLAGVSCPATNLCVAVARNHTVVHSTVPTNTDVSNWTPIVPIGGSGSVNGVSCPTTTLCVAVDGGGEVITSTNPTGPTSAWKPATVDLGHALLSVSCPSSSLCAAVDNDGNVVTATNPTAGPWTVTHVDSKTGYLPEVACPSTTLCVAVDDQGDVILSTNPAGHVWAAPKTIDSGNELRAVTCPSTSLCVAGDGLANIFTTTNPTSGVWKHVTPAGAGPIDGISCSGTTRCVAVATGFGNGGTWDEVISTSNPTGSASAWTTSSISTPLVANNGGWTVSCHSSLCVAGDESGYVLTTTNPAGGAAAWTQLQVDGNSSLKGLACPSSALCVAVDDAGNIAESTTPTNPNSWNTTDWLDANTCGGLLCYGFVSVSCHTNSLCVAGDNHGDIWTTTNAPAFDWSGFHLEGSTTDFSGTSITVVSCPSTSLCVAGDDSGNLLVSTAPTSGAWTIYHNVDGSNRFKGLSCPSTTLCVGTDGSGQVVWSTNPAGAFSAWHVTPNVDSGSLNGVSCPSTTLCVASDGNGNVLTSTHPTGSATSWSPKSVDDSSIGQISCPSTTQCVAFDQLNRPLTSTNPTGGPTAWSRGAAVESSGILDGIQALSCSTSKLCFASDGEGYAVSGKSLAPTISSFTPTSGITGSQVTISGSNFTGATSVRFGTRLAAFTIVSATQIKATVPNGAVTGKISVTTAAGTGTSASNFTPTLSITSFTPTSGPPATVVTINGIGFNSTSTVKFHGVAASAVTHVSATQLKATVSSTATTGPITVTNTTGAVGSVRSVSNYTVT